MTGKRIYRATDEHIGIAFSPLGCSAIGNMINPNLTRTAPPPGTSFVAGPARTLANVHVNTVFWGAWWGNNPLADQVIAAIKNLLAGPYMNYLAQYGVHRGSFRGSTRVADSEPGTFSFRSVGKFITRLLDDDRLPEPDDDWPNLYAVIMPPNSTFAGGSQVGGQNGYIIWTDTEIGDVDNDPAYYLWVGNDGTLDYITTVFSHELAELVTDPTGAGVRLSGCSGASCQIGDIATVCQGWCDYVRGVKSQAYWSELDANGVLPVKYSVRRTLVGKSIGGRIPRPNASLNAWIVSQF